LAIDSRNTARKYAKIQIMIDSTLDSFPVHISPALLGNLFKSAHFF